MRYRFLVAAGVLVAPIAATRLEGQRTAKPNVVLIMMDDLGYGDVGSYGAPDAKTPNIDRIAREGVRLTDPYANGAVCTPTRTALITGRYQQRYGFEAVLTLADTNAVLPITGTSLPALLKTNGYATALIGKWHLGFKRAFGPRAHGFDEFFEFLEATAVDVERISEANRFISKLFADRVESLNPASRPDRVITPYELVVRPPVAR